MAAILAKKTFLIGPVGAIRAHVLIEGNLMKTGLIILLSLASGLWGQLPPLFRIDTVAGTMPNEEGAAVALAFLTRPTCALSDGDGGVLIVEQEAHRVRRVTRDGKITTFAGTGAFGFSGDGGTATLAQLNRPSYAVRDTSGNVYVSDTNNHRVRRIGVDGIITTIVGDGGVTHRGDNGPAIAASIYFPQGIAINFEKGILYVAELGGAFFEDGWIRAVDLESGLITAFAGGVRNPADGIDAKSAYVASPGQMVIGPNGEVIFTDLVRFKVRAVTAEGKMITIAGDGTKGAFTNTGEGDGGPALKAKLFSPSGVAIDAAGMVYVSDQLGHRVRRFSLSGGNITTVTGASSPGFTGDGGPGAAARLNTPRGLNLADNGNLLIADRDNSRIRQITPSGFISTFAGRKQYAGENAPAIEATMFQPKSVALDGSQNLLFTDRGNHVVRIIDTQGRIRLHSGKPNEFVERSSATTLTVGPLGQVLWNDPNGIAVRADGTIYVVDRFDARVIDTKNTVTILGISGSKLRVTDIAVNRANTFVSLPDPDGNRFWRVNLGTKISEALGSGGDIAGDGGPVRLARMSTPEAVGYDEAGDLWMADSGHHRVRRANAADTIQTVVGTGRAENSGDFGPASAASIYYPMGIAFARNGIGYVSTAHCIRALFLNGTIATIAGNCEKGGFSGDAGAAITSKLNAPQGMAVDANGRVYFADSGNHRIRVLTPIPALRLELVSGDKQSRLATAPLERPLIVRLLAQGAIVYPFAPISFTVSQGEATVSSPIASTGADGLANIKVTLGPNAGPVVITASAPGLAPVNFALTARPVATIASVGGAAGYNPVAAPGSLMVISGANFDPTTACVYVNDAKVPTIEITGKVIVAQVPAVAGDTALIAVSGDCGTTGEVRSVAASLPLAVAAPEFFYWKDRTVRAMVADTEDAIGPVGLVAGRVFRPARAGDVIAISGTGFGPTDPALDAGVAATSSGALVLPVQVTLGESVLEVVSASPVVGKLGMYEVRVRIPDGISGGDLPIVLKVGEASSPDGATLTVLKVE